MRIAFRSILVPLIFMMTGCATIVSGTTQKINISSKPSGADVKVDGNRIFKTPTTVLLERENNHTVAISKEGYKTAMIIIRPVFNGMTVGNVLIGGIIGAGIDGSNGSSNKLIPQKVDIVLESGSGMSNKPQFSNKKDQEFYERNVATNRTSDDSSHTNSAEAEQNKTIAESTAPAIVAPQTVNFSPKLK